VIQSVVAWTPVVDFRTTAVRFEWNGTPTLDVSFEINQSGLSPTFGLADVFDVDGPTAMTTLVSEPSMGTELRSYDANAYALEVGDAGRP
jgi:hypothetical protein